MDVYSRFGYKSQNPLIRSALCDLSYSPNGEYLLSCTSSGDIVMNDVNNGEILWKNTGLSWWVSGCRDISWSPDSEQVAIAYGENPEDFAYSVMVRSSEDGEIVDRLRINSLSCIIPRNCAVVYGLIGVLMLLI